MRKLLTAIGRFVVGLFCRVGRFGIFSWTLLMRLGGARLSHVVQQIHFIGIGEITRSRHVGILATAGTIKSESYLLEIHKLSPDIVVTGEACPMWVSLVENNEYQSEGADYFVKQHINRLLDKDPMIDTIILGCTHYPLLLDKIRQFTPEPIRIISQGEYVARSLRDYLNRHPEMDARCDKGGNCRFLTTESENKFEESASIFLGRQDIKVKSIALE